MQLVMREADNCGTAQWWSGPRGVGYRTVAVCSLQEMTPMERLSGTVGI